LKTNKSISEIVRENIKNERLKQKLSQEEVALRADIHRAYLGAMERGEKPINLEHLEKISNALGVEAKALLE
jgi:transcriptional regulator with XRE-family HTH domain